MIAVTDFEQGTPEWFAARAGVPSASCFDKIVTSKGKRSTQRKAYMFQLAGEAILGEKAESYTNAAMERGIELESEARDLYEFINDVSVEEVALCFGDDRKLWSCSPDGLVGETGGIEIKCPKIHTHVEYLVGNKLPTKYFQQVQGSLFVTGREYWDFMSYFPGLPPLIVRVDPDLEFHASLSAELECFSAELADIINIIKERQ
ncbi:Exonuclease [Pseudodesulfovibrio profundus]|uniref:Exonuclease n=1 Tax=Pseudodesulfovibrio profundus TaxID=57320 RepID=A0A2C8FDS1_9BACT|nr:lambda exonuclease family protein [Pseudodesulfovibrio profundus]SOB60611.1 Exonuclease [Pseudodesulfovibrio profundus]